ncbi:hypothetical protein [Rubrobacter calidifluminis]|uniref:hypothetical protein n=1 Tax=Rubrobacter calidifluminis TaxID=1392640 RepID=UPI00235EFC42|nr:hypothetical protein [Rubrobacter calidifluminis]
MWLFARLCEEVQELEEAMYAKEGEPDPDAVREECADVANFCMMLSDVTGALEGRSGR